MYTHTLLRTHTLHFYILLLFPVNSLEYLTLTVKSRHKKLLWALWFEHTSKCSTHLHWISLIVSLSILTASMHTKCNGIDVCVPYINFDVFIFQSLHFKHDNVHILVEVATLETIKKVDKLITFKYLLLTQTWKLCNFSNEYY